MCDVSADANLPKEERQKREWEERFTVASRSDSQQGLLGGPEPHFDNQALYGL